MTQSKGIIGVVAFTGPAGCGKSVAAEYLKRKYGYHIMAFADPIKDMLAQLPNLELPLWTDRPWKETSQQLYRGSPRKLAQTLGTEWGRNIIHQDIWVEILVHKLLEENAEFGTDLFVIQDLRFENEAKWLREFGGILIHMTRSIELPNVPEVRAHVSEKGVEKKVADGSITNAKTLDELYEDVEGVHAHAEKRFKLLSK